MTAKISAPRRARKSRGVRRLFGQCAAAAAGARLAAISMSAFGADPAVGYSHTVVASPHFAPTGRRSIPTRPIDPPNREFKSPAATRRIGRSTLRRSDALDRMRSDAKQSPDQGRMLMVPILAVIRQNRSTTGYSCNPFGPH